VSGGYEVEKELVCLRERVGGSIARCLTNKGSSMFLPHTGT